jgi:hypothetical protein
VRFLVAVAIVWAGLARADNLLVNPNFDLDPTDPANGWTSVGDGTVEFLSGIGMPDPPSVRLLAMAGQAVTLEQCRPIQGGLPYDFGARSFTNDAFGDSQNSVALSVFSLEGCSGLLETVEADLETFPDWADRRRHGYQAPPAAQSARIELASLSNSGVDDIDFDSAFLPEPAASALGTAACAALALVGARRRSGGPADRVIDDQ